MSRTTAIMVGLILGDGHLTAPHGKVNTSALDLKYDMKYLEYLTWIHGELKELGPSPIKKKRGFHQYRFYTKRGKDLGSLRKIFYPKGKKIIPRNIASYLKDPLSLAIWYQDEGTLDYRDKYHSNALFATHCFSRKDCELLTKALFKNFDLDVRVCRCMMRGKLRYRLYVTSKSMDNFMSLIEPYMRRCFHYKLVRSHLPSQQQR